MPTLLTLVKTLFQCVQVLNLLFSYYNYQVIPWKLGDWNINFEVWRQFTARGKKLSPVKRVLLTLSHAILHVFFFLHLWPKIVTNPLDRCTFRQGKELQARIIKYFYPELQTHSSINKTGYTILDYMKHHPILWKAYMVYSVHLTESSLIPYSTRLLYLK